MKNTQKSRLFERTTSAFGPLHQHKRNMSFDNKYLTKKGKLKIFLMHEEYRRCSFQLTKIIFGAIMR